MNLSKLTKLLKGMSQEAKLPKVVITPEEAAMEQLKKLPTENLTEDQEAIRRYYEKVATRKVPEATIVDRLQKEMDAENRIKEWAKEKGLPYREKNPEDYIKPEIPFDPGAKERKVDRNSGTLRDIKDRNEPTIVSGGLVGGSMAMDEENGSNNDFVQRLKKALSDKYEEYGEKAGSAYNKMEDWAELLKQKQKEESNKTRKRFGMEPMTEEEQQLIEDIGMSSPAMGITRAVKELGPEVGKFINKTNFLNFGRSGEGVSQHFKDVTKSLSNYVGEKEAAKTKGAVKKALDIATKEGKDIDQLPIKYQQSLTQHGDEIISMLNDAAKNVRQKSVPKEMNIIPAMEQNIPLESKKEGLDILLDHYKDNPEMLKQIQKYINRLED
jgi:protein-tyrosine-phosphatase